MSNIYLHAITGSQSIPTPRLRSLLKTGLATVTDKPLLTQEIQKGNLPLYRINSERLYKDEKNFLSKGLTGNLYFCFPIVSHAQIGDQCVINRKKIESMFGVDLAENTFQCIRYKGKVDPKQINQFCQIYDKTFHFISSLIKVMSTGQYDLTIDEKETFSSAYMRVLSFANIRLRLECGKDIKPFNDTYPLWLQQFSKGIVILDVPNDMVANSLISESINFISKAYSDLKFISLSICKRFLMKLRNHPQYQLNKDKIESWISICEKLQKQSARKKWIPFLVVSGVLAGILLLKNMGK